MVTPYRQIHLGNMALVPHPLEIDVHEELAHEDLSEWIRSDGGLTGAAQEHLAEEDRNGGFV